MINTAKSFITSSEAKLLSRNLRTLLQEKNITELEIANAINMPVMTVRRIVSGETCDPRISTLKLLANYFQVSVDTLIQEEITTNRCAYQAKTVSQLIPILEWRQLSESSSLKEISFDQCENWQAIATNDFNTLSKDTFALESRHSMQPRYPVGTLFIIEPHEIPIDGDIVLIKINDTKQLSLRELIIDAPKWQLQPTVLGSEILFYDKTSIKIIGVVVLTLLMKRKLEKL